jgi:hypothetical protein
MNQPKRRTVGAPKSIQSTGLFKRTGLRVYGFKFSRRTEKQKAKLFAITGWVFRGEGEAAI